MSPRITVGLLAVLLALGGYVYATRDSATQVSATGGPPGASAPAGKDKPSDQQLDIWKIDDREIQAVTVQKGDQQTVVAKDADGVWRLQPSGDPADRLRLNGILLRLASLRGSRRFAEPGSPADYGLATPATTLTLRQGDATDLALLFGDKAPAEAGTYAKRSDEAAVFVVSNAIVQDVDRLVSEPPREQPTPVPVPTPAIEAVPTPAVEAVPTPTP